MVTGLNALLKTMATAKVARFRILFLSMHDEVLLQVRRY
jgi:hypothetical protein